MEHTPTPWTYKILKNGMIEITGPLEGFVFSPGQMTEANACFIVRAANSHAELLAALVVLEDHACETYPHFENPRGQDDLVQARIAIHNANKGTA